MPRHRRRLTGRQVFAAVALADVAACQLLVGLDLSKAVWLLNLPATITAGRLISCVASEQAALAVTVSAGAALYGWAGSRLHAGLMSTGLGSARDP